VANVTEYRFTRSRSNNVIISGYLAQVSATLLAGKQLVQKPGLYSKVKRILAGILDTAIEAKKLHGGLVPLEPPLAVHVDGHTVWYALDLDRSSATILVVEPASGGPTKT
jgi:hypothetical protein